MWLQKKRDYLQTLHSMTTFRVSSLAQRTCRFMFCVKPRWLLTPVGDLHMRKVHGSEKCLLMGGLAGLQTALLTASRTAEPEKKPFTQRRFSQIWGHSASSADLVDISDTRDMDNKLICDMSCILIYICLGFQIDNAGI